MCKEKCVHIIPYSSCETEQKPILYDVNMALNVLDEHAVLHAF